MKSEVIVLNGASHLNISSTCAFVSSRFKGGESYFKLNCSVRHKQVILFQSFPDTNNNLMELMLAIDTCKKSGASYIVVVLPIFPYARQDKRHSSGTPISSKIVCDMLAINCDRVITFDIHNTAIQGMMNPRVIFDHISMSSFLAFHLKKELGVMGDFVFVSPDAGAIKRTKELADKCGAKDLAIVDKTRTKASVVDEVKLIGNVEYRNCIVVDDMIDSAGTLKAVCQELSDKGAYDVICVATHPILSTPSFSNLETENVRIINTLPIPSEQSADGFHWCGRPENMIVYDVSSFMSTLINKIKDGDNISPLIDEWNE